MASSSENAPRNHSIQWLFIRMILEKCNKTRNEKQSAKADITGRNGWKVEWDFKSHSFDNYVDLAIGTSRENISILERNYSFFTQLKLRSLILAPVSARACRPASSRKYVL